jgi:NAD(P)-dependent dehydrogenase (short-subunit alcohol dehydrogenase family)
MKLGLEGKRVLVTGSTQGIGFATALGFAREGARVILNGRTESHVNAAQAKLLDAAPRAEVTTIVADVSTAAGTETLTRAAPDLDVLVNNAGTFEIKPFEQASDEAWLHLFQTNVMSGVRLSRYYLPRMIRADAGRIVFVSSESALQIPVESIHYGVSKTAQLAVARGLAELTAGTRVTVNSVLPGPTLSEGLGDFIGGMAKEQGVDVATIQRGFFIHARPSSLLKRFAAPAEVANMIVYLASDAASATNGAALRVDGGVLRSVV